MAMEALVDLLPQSTKRRSPTSAASVTLRRRQAAGAAGVQGPLGRRRRRRPCRCRRCSASGAGRRVARPDVRQDRHRPLFYVARLKYAVDAPRLAGRSTAASRSSARTSRPRPAPRARPAGGDVATRPATWSGSRCAFDLTKERRYVAVDRSAAGRLRAGRIVVRDDGRAIWRGQNDDQSEPSRLVAAGGSSGGFDHVESHDDQVRLFATRLGEGHHEFSYIVRATTAGTLLGGAGARRGDVRAGGVRPDRDGGDRGQEVTTLLARAAGVGRRVGGRAPPRCAAVGVAVRRSAVAVRRRRGLGPPRPAAGRSARRGRRGALDDRPRPQRRSALRSALRSRHARDAAARRDRLPPSLVAATLAAEDHRFHSHSGRRSDRDGARDVAQRRRPRSRRRRLDDHAAGRQAAARSTRAARRRRGAAARLGREDRGGGRRAAPRASAVEGRDPRAVPEPRALRQPDRRRRARQPRLLRQRQLDADAGAGRVPGGAAAASVALQPVAQPGAGDGAAARGAGADGAARLPAARPRRRSRAPSGSASPTKTRASWRRTSSAWCWPICRIRSRRAS